MADADHPTRLALLDQGLALAEHKDLASLSVNDIVQASGMAKGTFYVHFPDRAAYLVALHRRFHDDIRDQIRAATQGHPAGRARLERSVIAYLDACLHARAVKAMLLQARGISLIADEVAASNVRFATAAARDFTALHCTQPLARARLFVASAAEVAVAECELGQPSPALRAELLLMLTAGLT